MSGTIIDYLKEYGDVTLAEMPLNDVDSLVLCQLAYLKFDGIVSGVRENGPSISMAKIAEHADYENLFADKRFAEENRALFEAAVAGKRFCNMRLNCYINVVEKEWETQFSAVTYILEDSTLYIAFRGTDETIVGWKEDFNMAFLSPVPGQAYSVKYLNMVMGRLYKPFYIGGHSKGGNLAVYSAMQCIPRVQERILKIYSMDGPGFRPGVLEECGYAEIADRVVKILPHSALIGMIFEKDIHYTTVECKGIGLMQHDPFTWLVDKGHFRLAEDIYEHTRFQNDTLNEWIYSLKEEQLRLMVDTLYQVISASEADNLIDLATDWKKSMNAMIAAAKEIDEPTAKVLKEIMKSLFELAKVRMKEEVTQSFSALTRGERRKSRKKEALEWEPRKLQELPDAQDATEAPE